MITNGYYRIITVSSYHVECDCCFITLDIAVRSFSNYRHIRARWLRNSIITYQYLFLHGVKKLFNMTKEMILHLLYTFSTENQRKEAETERALPSLHLSDTSLTLITPVSLILLIINITLYNRTLKTNYIHDMTSGNNII